VEAGRSGGRWKRQLPPPTPHLLFSQDYYRYLELPKKKKPVTFSTACYVESIILNFYYSIIFVIDHSFLKVSPPFIKLRRSRKSTNEKTTMPI
jgi:hypothetical protein